MAQEGDRDTGCSYGGLTQVVGLREFRKSSRLRKLPRQAGRPSPPSDLQLPPLLAISQRDSNSVVRGEE